MYFWRSCTLSTSFFFFSINIVFSYVDPPSTIMYIVFVDFNKSSFQQQKKLTYSTHDHNISVQARNPLQIIKAIWWGKQKETLMATYRAVMRPALEYASSIWSLLSSSTSISKLQFMQNAALRTATGSIQYTN